MHYAVNVGGGIDMLTMKGKMKSVFYTGSKDYTLGLMAPGVKLSGEIGFMVNPDLSLNAGIGYKLGMEPLDAKFEFDGDDLSDDLIANSDLLDYSDLNMGGITFGLGLTYALGELPINIFGFLDPFKKH